MDETERTLRELAKRWEASRAGSSQELTDVLRRNWQENCVTGHGYWWRMGVDAAQRKDERHFVMRRAAGSWHPDSSTCYECSCGYVWAVVKTSEQLVVCPRAGGEK